MSVAGDERRAGAPTASPAIDLRACLRLKFESNIGKRFRRRKFECSWSLPVEQTPWITCPGDEIARWNQPRIPERNHDKTRFFPYGICGHRGYCPECFPSLG